MDTLEAIKTRKSSREFDNIPIPKEEIENILSYGLLAPSPKNDQPWRFFVLTSEKKNNLAKILYESLSVLKQENEKKVIKRPDIDSAFETVNIIKKASALVLVLMDNTIYSSHDDSVNWDLNTSDIECLHIQSIGAAIQNILLAATDFGIGCVWLGDVFYAYNKIMEYIESPLCMMAAIALGHSNDDSIKRNRYKLSEVCTWIE